MTPAQAVAKRQIAQLTLKDIGRRLNTVAQWLLAYWAGDVDAVKRSLVELPLNPRMRTMLWMAVDTVVARRQRQLDYELNDSRIRRTCPQ